MYKTETDSQALEQAYGCQWERVEGEGIVRVFGMDMYTLLYLKWITDRDLLYSTGNSAQCCVAAWIGGEFGGRMDTCLCMAESFL